MFSSVLKPFVINGTDLTFLLDQVRFRPLFDAAGNALIDWNGVGAIYDGHHNLIWDGVYGGATPDATAAMALFGTSYQTPVDLAGLRDVSGLNNNLALGLNAYGAVDQLFPRMVQADYSTYAVDPNGSVTLNGVTTPGLTSNAYAITVNPAGLATALDGTHIDIASITDGSARSISRMTTTAGVTFDTWANHAEDSNAGQHAASEIYYGNNGDQAASVLSWGDLETTLNGGLGQIDTQARLPGSAGADDHFIGGLNPGVSPSNGFFVLFGQFFDHGLDFIDKGAQGAKIKITLAADDPLYGMIGPDGQPVTSITINRASVASVDANGNPMYTDHTSPFIDQSQTYGSSAQLTNLLREWVDDPSTSDPNDFHAGMNLFNGTTLVTPWQKADGTMTHETLPTLNELRAHIVETGRDDITWEDVSNLRNRDASGHVDGTGSSGSALILDSNPRFDTTHLMNGNAAQDAAVTAAIATLNADVQATYGPGVSLAMVGNVLTLTGLPGAGPNPLTGASALLPWVNFENFSIMQNHFAVPSATISEAAHAAAGEILMASVGDHYIAGDGRVNENFGLTSIHHIFHEEHNFQVNNFLAALNREAIVSNNFDNLHSFQIDTNGGTQDANHNYVNAAGEITWDLDKVFQASKLIVEMEYQHAAVDQYARNVTPNIQEFVGYSPDKDPSVTLEYSQVAFRFGHSTLRETIDTIDPGHGLTGKIMGYALRAAFLNPDEYANLGPDNILLGMTHQQMNEVDEFVTPALNQGLLGQALDLAAINIARGRDIGIPTLNDMREGLGLTRYTSWNDFGQNMQHPESLDNFIAAYGFANDPDALLKAQAILGLADGTIAEGDPAAMGFTIDQANAFLAGDEGVGGAGTLAFNQIDSWLGGLAEIHQPGGLLGETFDLIFVTQIEALMDGDRFYYLYRLAGQQFADEVGGGQLKDIVERNTGLSHLNGNIFGYADQYVDFGAHRDTSALIANGGEAADLSQASTRLYNSQGVLLVNTGNTVGNEHKYGDLTGAKELGVAANNTVGGTLGVYSNGGRGNLNDGNIVTIGGVKYIQDTRLANTNPNSAFAANDGTNLDGTPNSGAESNEVLVGSAGDDLIYAQGGDDTVYGDAGNDKIYGGYGIDRLYGGAGSDTMYGGDNPDLMDGGAGDDFLYGESSGSDINGNDQVIGGAGNDYVSGGVGIDKLAGGSGDDFISGGQDTDPFTHGGDGNDRVDGDSGGDILYGDNGDDILNGGADQDQMFGGNGDDIIRPGDVTGALTIGSDEVLGGDGVSDINPDGTRGFDIIDFSDNAVRAGGVRFDLSAQSNPAVAVNGNLIQVPSFQIEGVVGSAGGDTLIGGSDHLDAAGNDVVDDNWLVGGSGSDMLTTGGGDDLIIGGSVKLSDLIGKYNSGYTHNNNNLGLTEADQLQDARYQGASHRVDYLETIDSTGVLDQLGMSEDKHFTELLRSDQFKNTILGDAAGVADTGSNDTAVFNYNSADYSITVIDVTLPSTGQVVKAFRIQDNGVADPNLGNLRDGTDVVIGVETFKFADRTFTAAELTPPAVSINDVSMTEGNSGTNNASFTVSIDHAYFHDIVVTYNTSNGSAAAPGDYTGTSGTVTIPAGSTSVSVNVPVVGDTLFEANETFNVNLTAASDGANIADNLGVGTITNDDTMPSLAITGASITEGQSGTKILTFNVTQSAASGVASTVQWSTADGSANAGSDYVGASGTLTIPAGSTTGQIQVTINGDTIIEGNETFTVNLTSPTNATITTSSATGTIIDDELNVLFNANFPNNFLLPGTGVLGSLAAIPAVGTTYAISNIVSPNGSFSMSGTNISKTGSGLLPGSTYSFDITATQGAQTSTETMTVITGGLLGDTITTGAGDTTVYAWTGNDTVTGGAGDDNLFGQDGNDTLVGGKGNDWMQGGSGTDTLVLGGARTNYSFTLNASSNLVTTDTVGTDGTDTFGSGEVLRFGGIAGTDNAAFAAGGAGSQVVIGSGGNDARNGGAGDDIIVTGDGDDTITYNVNNGGTANGGHDMVIGGAGTDTFILNGNNTAENFFIYSKTAYLAANPTAVLGADTTIVITRNGTAAGDIIAELSGIEEIKVNTTASPQTGTLANGNNYTGAVSGDQVHVIGNFVGTGLAYNTITINGSGATDKVDITGLTSDHRIVFNTNGGGDSVIGTLRPQDQVNGASSVQTVSQRIEKIALASESYQDGGFHHGLRVGDHGLFGDLGYIDQSHHFLV